jgi:histone deacetylase 1/2
LGIEVRRSREEIILAQTKYTSDILMKAGMLGCKAATTPMSCTKKVSKVEAHALSEEDATRYRSTVGALHYLTLTRPNISYAVDKVCQFLHAPWTTVKRILRYIHQMKEIGLRVRK